MQSIRFDFCGQHELIVPDGDIYRSCAKEIIEGLCYPFPSNNDRPVRSVVDLGAHAGEYTVMAAVRWPEATVHAFEPNPQIIPLLKRNCKPYANIVIHEQAVDVQSRTDRLYFSSLGSVAASIVKPALAPPPGYERAGADVEIVGADAVSALAPDILKLDIEGVEGVLLAALGQAVARIGRIYVEFHHENIRRHIDDVLFPTHVLEYARIPNGRQGEVMYLKRD